MDPYDTEREIKLGNVEAVSNEEVAEEAPLTDSVLADLAMAKMEVIVNDGAKEPFLLAIGFRWDIT